MIVPLVEQRLYRKTLRQPLGQIGHANFGEKGQPSAVPLCEREVRREIRLGGYAANRPDQRLFDAVDGDAHGAPDPQSRTQRLG